MLMKEAGMSYDDMARLNLYWKRLMMGFKEPKQIKVQDFSPLKLAQRAHKVAAGGWRTF